MDFGVDAIQPVSKGVMNIIHVTNDDSSSNNKENVETKNKTKPLKIKLKRLPRQLKIFQ